MSKLGPVLAKLQHAAANPPAARELASAATAAAAKVRPAAGKRTRVLVDHTERGVRIRIWGGGPGYANAVRAQAASAVRKAAEAAARERLP